jgi:hypothetical protein
MCPAVSMNVVGSDLWNASAHTAISVTYRVSAALQAHANVLNLAGKLRRIDRLLAKLLDAVYRGVENPPPNTEPVTPERVAAAIAILRNLHSAVERISMGLERCGLNNHGIIGAPASSMAAHADDILDLAESLELALNPDIDAIFSKSLEEYRRGEVFELQDIR